MMGTYGDDGDEEGGNLGDLLGSVCCPSELGGSDVDKIADVGDASSRTETEGRVCLYHMRGGIRNHPSYVERERAYCSLRVQVLMNHESCGARPERRLRHKTKLQR